MDNHVFLKEMDNVFWETLKATDQPPGMAAMDIRDVYTYLSNRRILARDRVLPIYIKPYFMKPETLSEFSRAVDIVLRCQEKVIGLYYDNPPFRNMFELDEAEVPLVEIGGPKFRHIYFSRVDTIVPENKPFQFLELNCDSPGGAYYADVHWEALSRMEVFRELSKTYRFNLEPHRPKVLKTLLSAWKDMGRHGKPRIAVMGDPDVTNVEEFKLFAEWFEDQGYPAVFTDPWSCRYDGSALWKDDFKIELIYRRGILADYSRHPEKSKPVVDAYRNNHVVIVNPFSSKLGDNKNLLEVMTDTSMKWLFTPEERRILDTHIPWTRIFRERKTEYRGESIDLVEYIRRNRRLFVIKPNAAYGGKGVVIGRECDTKTWDDAIEKALKSPHVAQEYVPIPEHEFPVLNNETIHMEKKKTNVNFFTFNGEFGGGFCRTSDSSIINISAGGALVSLCVVTPA